MSYPEDEFKEYVKMMTDSYAARGDSCAFELHRFPSVSLEQFEIVIRAHGLKLSEVKMVDAPLVQLVEFDKESEYYQTHLRHIVDAVHEKLKLIIFRKSAAGNFVNRFGFVTIINEGIIGKEVDGKIVALTDEDRKICVKNDIKVARRN